MIATTQLVLDYRGSASVNKTPEVVVDVGQRVYVLINSYTKEGTISFLGDPNESTVFVLVEPTPEDATNIELNGYVGPEGRKGLKIPFPVFLKNTMIIDPAGLVSKIVKYDSGYAENNSGFCISYFSPSMTNLANVVDYGFSKETEFYLSEIAYRFIEMDQNAKFVLRDSGELKSTGALENVPLNQIVFGGYVGDSVLKEESIYIASSKIAILYGGNENDNIYSNDYADNALDAVIVFPNDITRELVITLGVRSPYWRSIDIINTKSKDQMESLEVYDYRPNGSDLLIVARGAISGEHLIEYLSGNVYRIPIVVKHGVGVDVHPMGDIEIEGIEGRGIVFVAGLVCGDTLYIHDSTKKVRNDNDLYFDTIVLTPASDLFVKNPIEGLTETVGNQTTRFSSIVDLRRRSWYEVHLLCKQYAKSSVYSRVGAIESQWNI